MFTHPYFVAENVTDETLAEVRAMVASFGTKDQDETSIDLKLYRDIYQKNTGNECPLTDEELVFMITGVNDDLDEDDWLAVMKSRGGDDDGEELEDEGEATTVDRHTAASMERSAKAFAPYIEGEFMDTSLMIQEADETTKRGVAIMLWSVLHGPKAWGKEVWDMIPDLNITEKDANENKLNVLLPRWKVKDGNRNRVKDWFEIGVTHTSKGAALAKLIDDITAAGGNEVKTKDQEQYAAMNKSDRDNLLSTMEKRLGGIVNRWKRMVRLGRLIQRIGEHSAQVRAGLIPQLDTNGNEIALTQTVECIYLQQWSPNNKVLVKNDSFIPNTFLRMDVDEAIKIMAKDNTGFYDALLKTKDREPTLGDKDFKVPTTAEKFMAASYQLLHWYEDNTNLEAWQKLYAKETDIDEKKKMAEAMEDIALKAGAYYNFVKRDLETWREEKLAADKAAREKNAGALRKAG